MYNASEKYKNRIKEPGRTFKARLVKGTDIIDNIRSVSLYAAANGTDNIGIGGGVATYIDCQMPNTDKKLDGVEYNLEIGLVLDDGSIEYIPMGKFTPDKPRIGVKATSFKAYDRMYSYFKFGYFSNISSYPVDAKVILDEIGEQTGIQVLLSNLPDGIMISQREVIKDNGVDEEGNTIEITEHENPFAGYTYQEALCYIAALYGKYAIVNRSGAVEFRWYASYGEKYSKSQYKDTVKRVEDDFSINYIECQVGGNKLTVGTGESGIAFENPVMTQEVLNGILEDIGNFVCRETEIDLIGDLCLDIGDIIEVNIENEDVQIPVMKLTLDFDGGISNKVQAFGKIEKLEVSKGPTAKKIDRIYNDLLLVKEITSRKLSVNDLYAKVANLGFADIETLKTEIASIGYLTAEEADIKYAAIDFANVEKTSIGQMFADVGLITDATIKEGHVTGYLDSVEINANSITAGDLSVERLIIRGSDKSIVYALNNMTGALQSQNVDTLNGEILTKRSVNADKLIAKSITANEIAAGTITSNEILAGTITADKININDLFSKNITATNLNITGGCIDITSEDVDEDIITIKNGDNSSKYGAYGMNLEYKSIANACKYNTFYIPEGIIISASSTTGAWSSKSIQMQVDKYTCELSMFASSTNKTISLDGAYGNINVGGDVTTSAGASLNALNTNIKKKSFDYLKLVLPEKYTFPENIGVAMNFKSVYYNNLSDYFTIQDYKIVTKKSCNVLVWASIYFFTGPNGIKEINIYRNNTSFARVLFNKSANYVTAATSPSIMYLNVGDYIQVSVKGVIDDVIMNDVNGSYLSLIVL